MSNIYKNQTKLEIVFETDDMSVDFTGYDVNLFIIKPSGAVMTVSASDLIINLPNTVIYTPISDQDLNEVGNYKCYLSATELATGKELPSDTISFKVLERGTGLYRQQLTGLRLMPTQ
jgi:hypothetical protein